MRSHLKASPMYPRMASFPCKFIGCIVTWGEMTTGKEVLKVRDIDKKENNQGTSRTYGIQVLIMNGPCTSHIFTYLLLRNHTGSQMIRSLLPEQEIRKTEINSLTEYLILSNSYLSKSMSTGKLQHRNATIWGSVTSHGGIPEANMSLGSFVAYIFFREILSFIVFLFSLS